MRAVLCRAGGGMGWLLMVDRIRGMFILRLRLVALLVWAVVDNVREPIEGIVRIGVDWNF